MNDTTRDIKYSELESQVTLKQAYSYYKQYKQPRLYGSDIAFIVFFIFVIGFMTALTVYYMINLSVEAIFCLALLFIFIYFVNTRYPYFLYSRSLKSYVRFTRFAKDNNLSLWINDKNLALKHAGYLFGDRYDSVEVSVAFDFKDALNEDIEIGKLSNVEKTAKQKRQLTYICLKTGKEMPHIIIDSKNNNLFKKISNFKRFSLFEQNLDLEGDFNSHFTIFAPKNFKRDTLYILTPDIMQIIVDNFQDYDIEIIDDKLYLYKLENIDLTNSDNMRYLLNKALVMTSAIKKRTKYYNISTNIDNKQLTATQNARLKKRPSVWEVLGILSVFALVAVLIIDLISKPYGPQLVIFYIFLGLILWVAYHSLPRK